MYDILQLNDMLVPELLDIAEQLKISGSKKLEKQDLIYKILDKQAVQASEVKSDSADDKQPKRKRIIKASTANGSEEAIVESVEEKPKKAEVKKESRKKEEKPAPAPAPVEKVAVLKKTVRKKEEEQQDAAPAPAQAPAPKSLPVRNQPPPPVHNRQEQQNNNNPGNNQDDRQNDDQDDDRDDDQDNENDQDQDQQGQDGNMQDGGEQFTEGNRSGDAQAGRLYPQRRN